jgi:hypothetical protein
MQLSKSSIQFLVHSEQEKKEGDIEFPLQAVVLKSKKVPRYSREQLMEKWIYTLRATTYNFMAQVADQEDSKKIFCIFSSDCSKVVKGKGNMRRHIEWHLKRVEYACLKQKDTLFKEAPTMETEQVEGTP